MSAKEVRRAGILDGVRRGEMKLRAAAEMMGIGYRQAKRLWKRFRKEGAKGLVHGHAGRPSNRSKPGEFREKVLGVVRKNYSGEEGKRFGPTLAAEHLEREHGLRVDGETLRRWMLAEGLWSRARKGKAYRRRRERKEHFGELVQLDGSFHGWLEERGPRGCLMNMVDDATSRTMLRLGEEETTWAAADLLRAWVEEHGIPAALYTDWKNVYLREPTEKEELRGEAPLTQFGRMCAKLGIRILGASSPQAKGRVERNHGTHQDRLVKKMRVKKVSDYEAANRYLEEEYVPEHNRRFAVPAVAAGDYHRAVPRGMKLEAIFCLEEERTVSNDWVVRYKNRWLQLGGGRKVHAPAQGKVTVQEWRDGRMQVLYRGQEIGWQEIAPRKAPPKVAMVRTVRSTARKPPADHPWRRSWSKKARRAAANVKRLPAIA